MTAGELLDAEQAAQNAAIEEQGHNLGNALQIISNLSSVVTAHDVTILTLQAEIAKALVRIAALEDSSPEPPPDPDPEPPPVEPADYLWLSPTEVLALPDSGPAWAAVVEWADKSITPKLCDQENQGDAVAVACAVVYHRTGIDAYRDKAIAQIEAVIGTEVGSGCDDGGRLLAANRNLAAYCVAAELLGYYGAAFREWVALLINTKLFQAGSAGGATMIEAAIGDKAIPSNGGQAARMSLLAAAHYLGDADMVAAVAEKVHDWLGRSGAGWKWDPDDVDQRWQASYPDKSGYRGINPAGSTLVIDGVARNVDGVPPEDAKRSGAPAYPFKKENYIWEGLAYLLVTTHMLARLGYDVWEWQDRATLRAFNWLYTPHFTGGTVFHGDEVGDAEAPWIVDAVYGTSYKLPDKLGGPSKSGLALWPWVYG